VWRGAQAGTSDTDYLELLRAFLARLLDTVQPELLIYHVRRGRAGSPCR